VCGGISEFAEYLNEIKVAYPELVVIGISLDDSLKEVNRFLAKQKMPWLDLCDRRGWGSEAAKAFHITGIPSDVLIDAEGKVFGYSRTQLERLLAAGRK
jgi:hypothetical protein